MGRVLEIAVRSGYRAVSDVDGMIEMIRTEYARIAEPTRIVIAADWRACRVLTPAVSERVVAMLVASNPRLERSAILHNADQATSVLQVLRLVREAQLPHRRVFTDANEMEDWLGEVITPVERARVKALLSTAPA